MPRTSSPARPGRVLTVRTAAPCTHHASCESSRTEVTSQVERAASACLLWPSWASTAAPAAQGYTAVRTTAVLTTTIRTTATRTLTTAPAPTPAPITIPTLTLTLTLTLTKVPRLDLLADGCCCSPRPTTRRRCGPNPHHSTFTLTLTPTLTPTLAPTPTPNLTPTLPLTRASTRRIRACCRSMTWATRCG